MKYPAAHLAAIAVVLFTAACSLSPSKEPELASVPSAKAAPDAPKAPNLPANLRRTDTPPPAKILENVCTIFQQYPHWQPAIAASSELWGTPIPVMMAIIYQESKFNGEARPPNKNPLSSKKYASTAYGYSQALNGTWRHYQTSTGAYEHKRNYFADAVNFIGWYTQNTHKATGVKQNSAYGLYLAYHEGWGGYKRRTYRLKPWLMVVARKVQTRANKYAAQLRNCPVGSFSGTMASASGDAFFTPAAPESDAFFSNDSSSTSSQEANFFQATQSSGATKTWF